MSSGINVAHKVVDHPFERGATLRVITVQAPARFYSLNIPAACALTNEFATAVADAAKDLDRTIAPPSAVEFMGLYWTLESTGGNCTGYRAQTAGDSDYAGTYLLMTRDVDATAPLAGERVTIGLYADNDEMLGNDGLPIAELFRHLPFLPTNEVR